jgi:hypothetical protein
MSGYAQSFDDLISVSITDKSLKAFLSEFISSHDDEDGVYILDIFQKGGDQGMYEVKLATWWYPKKDDVASLAYTEIDNQLVFIYSGLEQLFPSEKRYKKMLSLIKGRVNNMYDFGDIPPTGTYSTASVVICDQSRKVYEAKHGLPLPDEYSCIYEEPPVEDR